MFKTAKVMNPQGEILDLMGNRDRFVVSSIQGLNPPPATLNMSNIYGMDGAKLNSRYLNTRNIVITMMLRGDQEASRQELYRFLSSNAPLRFFFENNNRNVYIDGFVETNEDDQFVRPQEMQASIVCPDPFFRDTTETVVELQNNAPGFEFPISIDQDDPIEFSSYEANRVTNVINPTQNETPFDLYLYFYDSAGGSTIIQNVVTGEKIEVGHGAGVGSMWHICTDPMSPKAEMYWANNDYVNLFPYLSADSVLFQLHPGENPIAYSINSHADDNTTDVIMKYRNIYRGV